jgi:NADH-quinone oxidoreductase subunit M
MFNHGIIAGAIFLAIGMIQESMGTIEISKLRMIVHVIPTGAMLFWLLLLASFGFPGMSSFIAEIYILIGAFQNKIIYGIIAMAGTLIMAGYIFSMLPRISFRGDFFRDSSTGGSPVGAFQIQSCNKKVIISLFFLAMIIIILGVYPKLLMSMSHNYVTTFLSRISLP